MAEEIDPDRFLTRDDRVIDLLERLKTRHDLLLYTNNNRTLTARILAILGFEGLFREIVTIEDGWCAKPAPSVLDEVMDLAGVPPAQCLFVGDRYDIDLRLPAERGCPVLLVTTVEELLLLAPLA
jgi:putative hydrolase of the HAD superfamily